MFELSLNEIRGKIQVYPDSWVNIYDTNCYAYALGLDVCESSICRGAFIPGVISGVNSFDVFSKDFDYDSFIEGLENDFQLLNILYREIEPEEKIDADEWKVALYVDFDVRGFLFDFHFVRTNPQEVWMHKVGFSGPPTVNDYYDNAIIDPRKCELDTYEYKKCYALKLKKW